MAQSLDHVKTPEIRVLLFGPRSMLIAMRGWARGHRAELISGALLVAMSFQMLTVIRSKGFTTDEAVHIPAGYYQLVVGDFQYLNPHPPTPIMLSALPLLFIQPNEPDEKFMRSKARGDALVVFGTERFWTVNSDFFQSISFWTRVPMIALAVLLGIVIFSFARRLFGQVAAVISVALFTIEPTILAHGRIIHTDLPSALGLFVFCFALYVYTSGPSLRRAVWLGAAIGLAPLTKFSMAALAPVVSLCALGLIIVAPRMGLTRRTALLHITAALVISLLIINAGYFFDHRPLNETDQQWSAQKFPTRAGAVLGSVRVLRHVLPTDFLMGIYYQISHSREGHPASLLGMYSRHGWWYYFPVAFALKTTVPFLITSIAGVFWALWRVLKKHDRAALFVLAPFLLFTALVMTSTINIGIRYYLPAYPFLFIMSGAVLEKLLRLRARRALALAVVAVVFGWSMVEVLRTYPNYLPYMNELAYRHPHWWYLSDSNVEWGEDQADLASYLRARGETKARAALLGGGRSGIEYFDMFAPSDVQVPETNYVIVGASFLNGSTVLPGPPGSGRDTEESRVNFFDEYRHRTPEVVIGNSIYVFRVR